MQINIKNSQLSNESMSVLNKLLEEDINASSAFKLMRIVKHISEIVEFIIETERKILNRWSKKNENGSLMKAKDENGNEVDNSYIIDDLEQYSKEMSDLLNIENKLPFDKLKFEDLGLKRFTTKDLIKIDFLFE